MSALWTTFICPECGTRPTAGISQAGALREIIEHLHGHEPALNLQNSQQNIPDGIYQMGADDPRVNLSQQDPVVIQRIADNPNIGFP